MDDRIINKQSGKTNQSVRKVTRVSDRGTVITISAGGASPFLVNGTVKMRPRNFFWLALERAKPKMDAAQRAFLDRITKE